MNPLFTLRTTDAPDATISLYDGDQTARGVEEKGCMVFAAKDGPRSVWHWMTWDQVRCFRDALTKWLDALAQQEARFADWKVTHYPGSLSYDVAPMLKVPCRLLPPVASCTTESSAEAARRLLSGQCAKELAFDREVLGR